MRRRILVILMSCMLVLSFAACGNGSDGSDNGSVTEETEDVSVESAEEESDAEISANAQESNSGSAQNTEDIESQVSIQAIPDEDGHVAVFIANNSASVIDGLEAQILYKDATGATIDMDEDSHDMVLPGSTVVSQMDAPDSYDRFETSFTVEIGIYPTYENHATDIQIDANQGEDCVIVEITNTGSVDIEEIEYIVLLYREDTLVSVGYSHDIYDVEAGQTVTEKESTYGKEYDRFEIYLNQAHTFGL